MDHRPPAPASNISLRPRSPSLPTPSNTNNNVFRPRRSDDWHQYRETIEQLYRNDQLKLRDVKHIMERDHKFYASEKQYKDRLAAWHVRKNIKAKDVQLMIRKQRKRAAQGKQTAFRVNGQEVDPKRIARFVRRYGPTWDTDQGKEAVQRSPEPGVFEKISGRILADQIETPSDMSYYTPEPDEESTSISPLSDLRSPSQDMGYPLTYDQNQVDTLPDLIINDDQNLSSMIQPTASRRPYSYHPNYIPPVASSAGAGAAAGGGGGGVTGDDIDADGEYEPHPPHPPEWNGLQAFQNRLKGLGHRLDRSMAPWAEEEGLSPGSYHEQFGSHEGTGM